MRERDKINMLKSIIEKTEFLILQPPMEKFEVVEKGKKRRLRASIPPNDKEHVFVYSYRAKRYGHYYDINTFMKLFDICTQRRVSDESEKTEKWRKAMKRAVKCMDESGLWTNIKEIFVNLLNSDMTWEEHLQMHKDYWRDFVKDTSICDKYREKYPFIVNENGIINSDYIDNISFCKLKSMYFGYDNKDLKLKIKQAITERRNYKSPSRRTSYDVSFSYDAQKCKAWYSEEFRDCGNGHYYLALNHSTALYYEDD